LAISERKSIGQRIPRIEADIALLVPACQNVLRQQKTFSDGKIKRFLKFLFFALDFGFIK